MQPFNVVYQLGHLGVDREDLLAELVGFFLVGELHFFFFWVLRFLCNSRGEFNICWFLGFNREKFFFIGKLRRLRGFLGFFGGSRWGLGG